MESCVSQGYLNTTTLDRVLTSHAMLLSEPITSTLHSHPGKIITEKKAIIRIYAKI